MNEFTPIATRQHNARVRLVECLAETGKITMEQAEKVATLYLGREIRCVKLDAVGGSFIVRDGRFFSESIINTAVEMIKCGMYKTVR